MKFQFTYYEGDIWESIDSDDINPVIWENDTCPAAVRIGDIIYDFILYKLFHSPHDDYNRPVWLFHVTSDNKYEEIT